MNFENLTTKIIHYTFYALFFLVPLIFLPGHVELFQFNKMMTVYFTTTIITSAWIIKMILQRKISIRRTPLDIPILLFLFSQVASTVFSIEPYTSIWGYYSRFHGCLLSSISYIFLYYAFVSNAGDESGLVRETPQQKLDKPDKFSPGTRARLKAWLDPGKQRENRTKPLVTKKISVGFVQNCITALLASATTVALYGILEHFGIDEHYWVQDVRNRVFSTLGQPNWLAAFLVTITPLAMFFSVYPRNHQRNSTKSLKLNRLLSTIYLVVVAMFYLTLLYTKSRSGLLGFAVIYVAFWGLVWLSAKRKGQRELKNKQKPLLQALRPTPYALNSFLKTSIILLVITLSIGTPFTPNITQIAKRLTTKPSPIQSTIKATPKRPVGGTPSEEIRKIVWRGAINVWRQWPILGSGVETFAYSYYNFRPIEHNFVSEWDFLYNKAHNEYLNFLATTGILGLGSYLLLQSWFVIWSLKTIFSSTPTIKQTKAKGKSQGTKFSQAARARLKNWFMKSGRYRIFAGSLDASKTRARHPKADTFSSQIISDPKKFDTRHNIHLLIALIAGYAGLAVVNFFGFSTVTPGLLFFIFPAFAFSIVEDKPILLTLRPSPSQAQKKYSSLQKILLIIVLVLFLYTSLQLGQRWYADRLFTTGKKLSDSNQMTEALIIMQKASTLVPNEPLFHDRLALDFARSASALYQTDDATSAAQLAQVAAAHSDLVVLQNPVHLNYLKNRAATMLHLATIDPDFEKYALEALLRAAELSPTDPKIPYNLGLLYIQQNQLDKAVGEFEKAVSLKPDYEPPRIALAVAYEELDQLEEAITQYEAILEFHPQNPTVTSALERLATESSTMSNESFDRLRINRK